MNRLNTVELETVAGGIGGADRGGGPMVLEDGAGALTFRLRIGTSGK